MELLDKKVQFTPQEIADLEKQYGELTMIELTKQNTDEKMLFCFKEISRQIIKAANAKVAQTKNGSDFIDVILESTLINGKDYLNNGKVYVALQSKIEAVVSGYDAEVVKKN
ncbi:hypothetical protein [Raineya sp.]